MSGFVHFAAVTTVPEHATWAVSIGALALVDGGQRSADLIGSLHLISLKRPGGPPRIV